MLRPARKFAMLPLMALLIGVAAPNLAPESICHAESPSTAPLPTVPLRLTILHAEDDTPSPARVSLTASDGTAFFFESLSTDGQAVIYDKQNWINPESIERHTTLSAHPAVAHIPPGDYRLRVYRGHETLPEEIVVKVDPADPTGATVAPTEVVVRLRRWSQVANLGWFSGDTHLHRSVEELKTILPAEDLNVALPLTEWVTRSDTLPANSDRNLSQSGTADLVTVSPNHVIWPLNTEYEIFSVGDQPHTLGALFVLGHKASLPNGVPPWEPVVQAARKDNPRALFDMDKLDWPFSMILPPLVPGALYELSNNHVWQTEFAFRGWNSAAPNFMIPPFGASEGGERDWIDYTLGMYYTLLNCGLKLPPTAGTAHGVHPVPAGFSRVYVHLPNGFNYDDWISGLAQGRSFVTTGPMLQATANGNSPGHIFTLPKIPSESATNPLDVDHPSVPFVDKSANETHAIEMEINVQSLGPILYGEILVNGIPEILVRPQNVPTELGTFTSKITTKVFPRRSGWIAFRAWETRPDGRMRFAHTAPWYLQMGDEPVRPRAEEKRFLVDRVRREIQRSKGIISDAAIAEYEKALAFYEGLVPQDDSRSIVSNARKPTSAEDQQRWFENMVLDHGYTIDEVRSATGMELADIETAIRQLPSRKTDGQAPPQNEAAANSNARLKILPYPGGRHPRRGFLDGAIDPQRETKVSIFAPWNDGGYVVVDLPEAVFSNLGLTYLAHTHIPTIWDNQGIRLEPTEWEPGDDGALVGKRVLPNGITLSSSAKALAPTPAGNSSAVEMTLRLTNGTSEKLTGLRVQVCTMLKGALGFNAQQPLKSITQSPLIAIQSVESPKRWIVTAWTPCQRVWSNPPVPCVHSDPQFPDCAPGQTVEVTGGLWFYEGDEIESFLREQAAEFASAISPDRAP